jgi:flagellin-like protein
MRFKKAVSPLIATILLIVVAVILVTVVLTWGKNFATDSISEVDSLTTDDCLDALGTLSLSNCVVGDDNFTVRLRNISNTYQYTSSEIFDAEFITTTDQNSDSAVYSGALSPGETKLITIDLPSNISTPFTLKVMSTTCPTDGVAQMTCR